MDTSETPNVPVKSVERSIRLVEAVQRRSGANLTELADDLGVAKSTVHNHLLTLERHGYLVRTDDTFHVGFRALDHGGFARERVPGYRFVRSELHDLADETGELCQFVARQGGEGFVLFQTRGSDAVETQFRVGSHGPLHSLPGGKAVLAQLPVERISRIVEENGLGATTPATITDPGELFTELERTTNRGYAVNDGEYSPGLNAVSVPVESDAAVLGALCVVGPTHRLNDDATERRLSNRLLEAANELELNVTYSRA
ncbi:IclR family transcriptional regulator [Halococcus salsus]|uniref:IclR family transcriptional regulator n=1 Tax=Halococcus salsus TaxID=2162894 RepID=UPI00135A2581|nr:IclR family transcriptional regulator [Halococcus salsus]